MLFHSLAFFVFFPLVVVATFATPARYRWAVLLMASYIFYGAWKPAYLLLIIISTAVDYLAGKRLAATEGRARRAWLGVSLTVNLGLLVAFKYLDFIARSLETLIGFAGVGFDLPALELVLPVGISFYTFQTLSYTIDVYRGERGPERHFGRFALYVSFFPQLVAGPIERSTRLLPQLDSFVFDRERLVSGLGLMLWGFFKKMVVADRAARFVDAVYGDPGAVQGVTIWLATYAFALQIYGDFSGYSDIAIGAARVLGIDLSTNFIRPYAARSVRDFWRRWHVTLSTWFRDYLYVPLGGSRVRLPRQCLNLMVVFLVSGLWHGASWTFVLWGGFHGVLLVAAVLWQRLREREGWARGEGPLGQALAAVGTFHLVCLGWLIFRADDLTHLAKLLLRLPISYPRSLASELSGVLPDAHIGLEMSVLAASAVMLALVEKVRHRPQRHHWPAPVRLFVWAGLGVWTLLFAAQSHSPFLYFQF